MTRSLAAVAAGLGAPAPDLAVKQNTSRGNARNPQPLHALELPDALLRIQTVAQATGLSTATVYRKLAAGQFPGPIRLGARCTRWKAADVRAWIQAQGAAS